MADDTQPRKLATIVALDIAGYSARTEADETRTTAEVPALRKVIEGIAAKHGGRVFNTAGDGFMLEFGSSLAAVEAAFELAQTCEPKVRVGVHLGDVVVQPNGDLLGHGVNVAARLMARSQPGAALVSNTVRQTIRGPVAERLQSCGTFKLDKMAETIEAFALTSFASAITAGHPNPEPLLAVLPFDNLSDDKELQFFSDGVSEEILQRLMRVPMLKVVGRTSSFQFRGAEKSVRKVASELHATHILDGTIRRAAGRVRVAAHLVEAASQTTLWSDRFDRGLEDIFAVQDEISENIARALNRTFLGAPLAAVDPEVYDLYLRASRPVIGWDEVRSTIGLLEEVAARAPNFADAWGSLAAHRAHLCLFRPFVEREAIGATAAEDATRALRLDPANPGAMAAEYLLLPPFGKFVEAEATVDRLVKASHGVGFWLVFKGMHLESVGRVREAIHFAQRAQELDALHPHIANAVGQSLWFGGRYSEARRSFEATLKRWPDMHYAAFNLILLCAVTSDWPVVDAMLAPARLAQFPLRQLERLAVGTASVLRDPLPASRRRPIETARAYFEKTGCARIGPLAFAAHCGTADEAYDLAARARIGPAGDPDDDMGIDAYRTYFLFHAAFPEFRRDPRFVRVCAKLGLVEYWLTTQHWPDCVEELAPYYDFKAECEKANDVPKQAFCP